ncbi:hypothetical protein PAXRUDRAFT_156425 [Paxillus rubicundulus Ve08.2h10]|uniref:Unplaced genomic scaffold scaffold_1006, whole genome shotgun sequence n=1 Tax=Paxillus rubicundulus Ve08.2h10 TaxID=930991 RepID=A0A0D0DIB1_9AGAM|nr:hypothetical protein PAXRUDRAFT_156425 [Paxillus rubicundulus Ve08.2h10]
MQLTLSSESVRNAVMTNESGQVLYKTSHPFRLKGMRTTTIQKIRPNADPVDMHDDFCVMGEIEWRLFGSSTFRINGQEMLSNNFLPRHGITGRKRTFTGPDGRPYRWDMLFNVVVLSRDEEPRTEVARYHRRSLGIIGPKKKPCLDIHPDVMHMLDLIVLTFVYVEKLREDKERAAYSSGGG